LKRAKKVAAKKKSGRPPLPAGERRRPIEVTLPLSVIERARTLGDGNVSAGLVIAVDRSEAADDE
jgi:hypothetical protein